MRQSRFRLSSIVGLALFCLFLSAPPACAQGDRPLTKRNIIDSWDARPQQDAQRYIDDTVRKRKVGFLPTEGIRGELRRHHLPREVIDALRLNIYERDEFKFQVWLFESRPAVMSSEDLTKLAREIIAGLKDQSNQLNDVFRHFKPPLADPCVQTQGSACPSSTGPLLQVKGSVEKSGSKLKAVVRLSYLSSVENQPIGSEIESIIAARTETGLKNAAADIVRKIHDNIRREVKEF